MASEDHSHRKLGNDPLPFVWEMIVLATGGVTMYLGEELFYGLFAILFFGQIVASAAVARSRNRRELR